MWICLNDAFLSIVDKDCEPNQLMVRARRREHILAAFPDAEVSECATSDYQFRAAVDRNDVAAMLVERVMAIDYSNFKDSVEDDPLHNAYQRCWHAMAAIQPKPPYSGRARIGHDLRLSAEKAGFVRKPKGRTKRRKT